MLKMYIMSMREVVEAYHRIRAEKIKKSAKTSTIFSEKGSRRIELSVFMRIFAKEKQRMI